MQCKSEMEADVDIEEHNMFDNARLTKVFPDIAVVKKEVDEDSPALGTETGEVLREKHNGDYEGIHGNQSPTANFIDINVPRLHRNDNQNLNTISGLNTSSNVPGNLVIDSKKEQIIKYNPESELVPKEEIITCKVCSKDSDEEKCKQRVKCAEGCTCSPSDRVVFHVIENNTKPPEINFACDRCAYTSFEKCDLEKHLLKHTRKSPFKCYLCDYKCARGIQLKNHIKGKHTNEKNYSCNMCEYKSVRKSDLNQHLRKHTGEKPYKCDLCDFTSSQSGNLKIHVRSKHTNQQNYTCNMCEYKSVRKSDLNQHLRRHTGEKPFKCDLCDFTSSQCGNLKSHIKAKHTTDPQNYSCNVCEYKTVIKNHLIQHLRKHTGEKPYKCELCDYMSARSSQLKFHIKAKHCNQKNYTCSMCEYKSVRKSDLNQHLRKHTGEKPYKCDLCDYMCAHSSQLKDHIRAKHTNEKNYSCTMCEFKSVTRSQLSRHLRKHTGEKPYKCDLCDFTSSQGGNLKKHTIAKHTDKKNYLCSVCQYKAITKSDLNQHLWKHIGENPCILNNDIT